MFFIRIVIVLCFYCLSMINGDKVYAATAQSDEIEIVLRTDEADWLYNVSDTAYVDMSVLLNGQYAKGIDLQYEIGIEGLKPTSTKKISLNDSVYRLSLGTLDKPGFIRCVVTVDYQGEKYIKRVTVGFDVDDIR